MENERSYLKYFTIGNFSNIYELRLSFNEISKYTKKLLILRSMFLKKSSTKYTIKYVWKHKSQSLKNGFQLELSIFIIVWCIIAFIFYKSNHTYSNIVQTE